MIPALILAAAMTFNFFFFTMERDRKIFEISPDTDNMMLSMCGEPLHKIGSVIKIGGPIPEWTNLQWEPTATAAERKYAMALIMLKSLPDDPCGKPIS